MLRVSLVAQNGPENWHLATFANELDCLCNYNNNNNSLFNSLAVTYWINELYYMYISAYIKYKSNKARQKSHAIAIKEKGARQKIARARRGLITPAPLVSMR